MKNSKQKSALSRALATGVALVLVGGVSLVAAAPAHAAVDYLPTSEPDVFEADIRGAQAAPLGWHLNSDSSTAQITDDGLSILPGEAVTYTFDDSYARALDYNLSTSIDRGDVTWTTPSLVPADYEMFFSYGADGEEPSYTALTSTEAEVGLNTASLDQTWTTSNAIGTEFDGESSYTLRYLLSYLEEQPNSKVVSFGVSARPSPMPAVVSSLSWDTGTYTFREGTRMVAGTVTLTGTPTVGSVITAETAGWPENATFAYEWFEYQEFSGSQLDGTAATHTVGSSSVNNRIGVFITVSAPDMFPVTARANTELVTATKAPAAVAPVATSADLAAFLTAAGVEIGTAASAGLPAGDLDATKPYTATVDWFSNDSFVDVYAYSTPTLVGTFAVVNGQVQVVLSPAMLALLASGSHTLVLTGQSSGAVSAVAFSVAAAASGKAALAATGVDPIVPLGCAALLLMLGAAFVIVRRRRAIV